MQYQNRTLTQKRQDSLDNATSYLPYASDGRDFYEAATRKDFVTEEPIRGFDYFLTLVGVALPFAVSGRTLRQGFETKSFDTDTRNEINYNRHSTYGFDDQLSYQLYEPIEVLPGREFYQPIDVYSGSSSLSNGLSYSYLPDPQNVGAGEKFSSKSQRQAIFDANRQAHGGQLVSDQSGIPLVPGQKHTKGVTPPSNEAQIDHIIARSKGGTNSNANARVLSREENRTKSDK